LPFPGEDRAGLAGRQARRWQTCPQQVAVLRADLARLRGDVHGTIHLMRQVLSCLPAGERVLRFNADWNLARAHWVNGDLDQAEQALADLIAAAHAAGEYYLILAVCWELGRVQRAQGRLGAALATYRRALAVGAEAGSPSLPAAGIAQLGVAAVLYERGELAAALEQAAEGVARCRQLAGARLLAEGLVVLARVRQALGDQAGAVAAVAEAERIGPSPDVVDLFNPAPAARARLMLARGQLAEAAAWAAARGLDAGDPPSYPRECEHLLLARLLLAQGEPEARRARAAGRVRRADGTRRAIAGDDNVHGSSGAGHRVRHLGRDRRRRRRDRPPARRSPDPVAVLARDALHQRRLRHSRGDRRHGTAAT